MAGHRAAILFNGNLYCWGRNDCGQVGNGTTDDQYTPVKILENVKQVYLDDYANVAITTNGDLYFWGRKDRVHFGSGTANNQCVPVKILENVKQVYLHGYTYVAITTNSLGYNR